MKPNWQHRRAELLARACEELLSQVSRKRRITAAVHRVVKRYKGRRLGSGKRLALSRSTMLKHYYRWRDVRSAAAFQLNFKSNAARGTARPYTCFLVYHYAISEQISLREAFRKMQRAGLRLPFSYQTLCRHLPARMIRRCALLHSRHASAMREVAALAAAKFSDIARRTRPTSAELS